MHSNCHMRSDVGWIESHGGTVVSAYLRRVGGPPGRFDGYAVDISHGAIAAGTKTLLAGLNVSFVYRKALKLPAARRYDFCFIDGDHSYTGIRADFGTFAPACTHMMFHDIQDISTVHLKNFTGGVPMFWAHLTGATHPARRTEFIHQPAEVRFPTFGLGVLGPNAQGTCEPDTPIAQWPVWGDEQQVAEGATAEPVWRELCRYNRTRLCALGAAGIVNGQKWKLGTGGGGTLDPATPPVESVATLSKA